jgi:phosphoribosylanthranilate isomerase
MTLVKICGLMSAQDIMAASDADYLGFVIGTGTRRSQEPDRARDLMALSPVPTVMVTTITDPLSIANLVERVRPSAVQLCGHLDREMVEKVRAEAPCEVWTVLHVDGGRTRVDRSLVSLSDRVIIDTASPQGGGSGQGHDLDISARLVKDIGPLTGLAGGLDPQNVASAIQWVRPGLVDVSTGVETAGSKDPEKIRDFIMETRRA